MEAECCHLELMHFCLLIFAKRKQTKCEMGFFQVFVFEFLLSRFRSITINMRQHENTE
jgi:hypothetical protein